MNYLELTNAMLKRLNETELTSGTFVSAVGFHSLVKDCVNSSIRDIIHAELEWPFLFTSGPLTFTSGSGIYIIPTSAVRVDWDSFQLISSSALGVESTHIKYIDYDEWQQRYRAEDDKYVSGVTSIPERVFRTQNLQFGFSPVPDKAYVIAYDYWASPNDLSAAGDTTVIPTRYHWTIVDGAMYHLYMFRENFESAGVAQQRFTAGIKRMRVDLISRLYEARDDRVRR